MNPQLLDPNLLDPNLQYNPKCIGLPPTTQRIRYPGIQINSGKGKYPWVT